MRYLLLVLLACAPLAAQELMVGAKAPEIPSRNWINPPTWGSLAELQGDVVLIKSWGKN